MDFLKELFANGALTFEQFSAAIAEKGYKLADLSTGNYVAKKKYEDDIQAKDTAISTLNTQLSTRDTDLATLKADLEAATQNGATTETTIADLNGKIATLQTDYETAKKDFETKLSAQKYEFAVREFAGSQNFSSKAAKEFFINDMVKASLKMKDNKIIGADDFLTTYKTDNADSFIVTDEGPKEPETPKPTFVQPTPPAQGTGTENPFDALFNFNGVR